MEGIYRDYQLIGLFLILDINAGINDIDTYSKNVMEQLEYQMNYRRDNMYMVIIQYTVGDYGGSWQLKMSITTGGEYARGYISDSEAKDLIDEYGPYIKVYNYNNMLRLINGIRDAVDTSLSGWAIALIVLAVLILICCGGGGGYYYTKRRAQSHDMGGGIHVTSGQF